jgi:outer membrane beta-barrel protein
MHTDLNPHVTRRSEKNMPMNKMPKSGHQRFAALLIAAAVTVVPLAAQAQRKSPLADAPAIRKRYELRASRLEVGAGLGSTINQDFFHSIFVNAKLGYHITDWLALSVYGDFAVASLQTTFQSDLVNSLSTNGGQAGHPASEPTQSQAQASMEKIKGIYGAQLEGSFFTGKYSLFGKLFANYDFEILGGVALINVAPKDATIPACTSSAPGAGSQAFYCGVTGNKIGGSFGVGMHSYFNHWMALNVELRDTLAKLNPSGRDTNSDLKATTDDLSWTHTFTVGANLVFYIPPTPNVSP